MAGRQNDKWVLKTYGYDVAQLYQTLYSISGHPIEQKRRLLLVEGPDDKKFYEQYVITGVPIFFSTQGCENMNALVDLLHKDNTPFLAIQDSDFYYLDGNKQKKKDLFYTDKHDWEMTALANYRVFITFMSKYGLKYKDVKRILVDSLKDLEYLSYYKWYNVRYSCNNDFVNINAAIQIASTNDLGDYAYLTSLIPGGWRKRRLITIQKAVLPNYILSQKLNGIEYQLITGHHLLDRFLFYLAAMGIRMTSRGISRDLIKSVYDDEFKKTNLYKQIKRWEANHIKVFKD